MVFAEETKQNDEWNFVNSVGKKGIHTLFQYPGTMVPDMLNRIIETYLSEDDQIILDPFMGSGTVLFETVKSNRKAIGIDINPYACFGVKVKSNYYSKKTLHRLYDYLKMKLIDKGNISKLYSFPYIEKWYNLRVIEELSRIREEVLNISQSKYRDFFLLCLAEVAGKSSNSRTSTFKLHIRTSEDINNRDIEPIKMFLKIALNSIQIVVSEKHHSYHKNITVYNQNTVKLKNTTVNKYRGKIDAIITSPPYGDNHTTITYGQYSYLRYCWIGKEFLNVSNQIERDIFKISGVDSNSAGGKLYNVEKILTSKAIHSSQTLKEGYYRLTDLNMRNARKVLSFYIDFYHSLIGILELLKNNGVCVFIVGDRNVSGENIPFKEILLEMTENLDMQLVDCIPRKIVGSYMASSIKQEHIIVLKKKTAQ